MHMVLLNILFAAGLWLLYGMYWIFTFFTSLLRRFNDLAERTKAYIDVTCFVLLLVVECVCIRDVASDRVW